MNVALFFGVLLVIYIQTGFADQHMLHSFYILYFMKKFYCIIPTPDEYRKYFQIDLTWTSSVEHNIYRGISHKSYLVIMDLIYISWYRNSVSTAIISICSSNVNMNAAKKSDNGKSQSCNINTDDDIGIIIVTSLQLFFNIGSGTNYKFVNNILPDINSHLIHTEDSYLQLYITIFYNEVFKVKYITCLDMKWFSFKASQSFFLNGQCCFLYGPVHQDYDKCEDTVINTGFYYDIKHIKMEDFISHDTARPLHQLYRFLTNVNLL